MIRNLFVHPESAGALALLGALFGAAAVLLVLLGNPASTGFCASCFLVNVAGAVGLHGKASLSYLRPELLGVVLGAFFAASGAREFRVRGGASPAARFVGGGFLLLGCEVFIGCPIKVLLRTAGGGLVGLVGLAGLASGVLFALFFLRDGYALRDASDLPEGLGFALPGAAFLLLLLGSFGAGAAAGEGASGPVVHHAPFASSAIAGLLIGAAAQRSRFCITGGIRTAVLARDGRELAGIAAFLGAAVLLNAATGLFAPSYSLEPGVHTDILWAFVSMSMVGFGAILVAGCPFRQIVLAAGGDLDAAAAVAGMLAAAALSVALGIGSTVEGVTGAGKLAVLLGWIYFLAVGIAKRKGR